MELIAFIDKAVSQEHRANTFMGTFKNTYIYHCMRLPLNSFCSFTDDTFFLQNGEEKQQNFVTSTQRAA